MNPYGSSDHLTQALVRASEHWRARHQAAGTAPEAAPAFTIAFSREAGARGTSVARQVGARLGWPVYDHELLEHIAREMKVRVGLLETVDERQVSWLQES